MQQGKAMAHGKGAREKGAKAKERTIDEGVMKE